VRAELQVVDLVERNRGADADRTLTTATVGVLHARFKKKIASGSIER
jgi:hypothetical protein